MFTKRFLKCQLLAAAVSAATIPDLSKYALTNVSLLTNLVLASRSCP